VGERSGTDIKRSGWVERASEKAECCGDSSGRMVGGRLSQSTQADGLNWIKASESSKSSAANTPKEFGVKGDVGTAWSRG